MTGNGRNPSPAHTSDMPYFVELWDVTGSARFTGCRDVFYQDVNGALLFHDLTNRRSRQNLQMWEQVSPSSVTTFLYACVVKICTSSVAADGSNT